MNIFNTQPLNMNSEGLQATSGAGLGALENQLMLDPEALKLLEGKALAEGVDFEQVLNASKNGQDPDAVIELLKNQNENTEAIATKLLKNIQVDSEQVQEVDAISSDSNSNKQNLKQQSSELSALLNKDSKNVMTESLDVEVKPEQKIIQNKKDSIIQTKSMPQTAASLGLGASFGLTKQTQTQNSNMAQANLQQLNHEKNSARPIENNTKVEDGTNNLLKLSDFMAKQSPSIKTNAAKQAYQPVSKSIFNKKVESSLPGVIRKPSTELKVQDIMLGKMDTQREGESEMNQNSGLQQTSSPKVANLQTATKVFDMSQIKSSDATEQIISKVQDYIIQSRVSRQPEVQMSFQHAELGQVDLLVSKAGGDILNVSVAARAAEGAEFFTKNQGELLRTLAQSGVQIGEFKLETSQGNNNNQSTAQDSSKQQFGQEGKGQHQSENGQRDSESKKREELWNQFQDKEVA